MKLDLLNYLKIAVRDIWNTVVADYCSFGSTNCSVICITSNIKVFQEIK